MGYWKLIWPDPDKYLISQILKSNNWPKIWQVITMTRQLEDTRSLPKLDKTSTNKKHVTIHLNSEFTASNQRWFFRILPTVSHFYLTCFTIGMLKTPNKSNKKEGLFWLIFWRYSPSWQGAMATGAWGSCSHHIHSQEAEKNEHCCPSSFLFFVQVRSQAQATEPPTILG